MVKTINQIKKAKYDKEYSQRKEVKDLKRKRNQSPEAKEYHRNWFKENKEKAISYAKKYRENNLDKVKEREKKYLVKNRIKINQKRKIIRKTNKEYD